MDSHHYPSDKDQLLEKREYWMELRYQKKTIQFLHYGGKVSVRA